jgi:uncharacterized protein YecA (UPF0149 family)
MNTDTLTAEDLALLRKQVGTSSRHVRHKTPEQILQLQRELRKDPRVPGRNGPCPCGAKDSQGRPVKFKHCCLKRHLGIA